MMNAHLPSKVTPRPVDGHELTIKEHALSFGLILRVQYARLYSASYVSRQRDTARSCCWAPAVQQSIDISCQSGPQQQTRRRSGRRPNDGTDRRTGGQTDTQPLHTMRAVSMILHENGNLQALFVASSHKKRGRSSISKWAFCVGDRIPCFECGWILEHQIGLLIYANTVHATLFPAATIVDIHVMQIGHM